MIIVAVSRKIEDKNLPKDNQIEDVVLEALGKLKIEKNLEVEVIFVDKQEISELNIKHREINKPTDVLSFPQAQVESSELNILGSIVICPPVAEEKGESIEELVKHGLLHLCGYDHETDDEEWLKAAKAIDSTL